MFSTTDIRIAVIGLGYVGLPLVVEFGKNFQSWALIFIKRGLMNYVIDKIILQKYHQKS